MGLPGCVSTKGKNGKSKRKWTWQGGVKESLDGIAKDKKILDAHLKNLRENTSYQEALKRNIDAVARASSTAEQSDFAHALNSQYLHHNAEHDNVVNYISSRLAAGLESEIAEDIAHVQDMSVEQFRESFLYKEKTDLTDAQLIERKNKLVSEMQKKVESVREITNLVNRSFINFDEDTKGAIVHAFSVAEDSDEREDAGIDRLAAMRGKSVDFEVEETKAERDAREEKATKTRSRNIWHRLTRRQQIRINNSPEAQIVKKKLNLKELSTPTHLEELYYELGLEDQRLEDEINAVGTDSNLDKKAQDIKIAELMVEQQKVRDRHILLAKEINNSLDPNLSKEEQAWMDEWKKEDPKTYALHKEEAMQLFKDNRKLRARRHRAINLYNQLIDLKDMQGNSLSPLEIRLERVLSNIKYANDELREKDPKLANLYERYSNTVVDLEYTKKNGNKSTMRVFVEGDKDVVDGKAQVLRRMPSKNVIALNIEKDKLQKELAEVKKNLETLTLKARAVKELGLKNREAALESKIDDVNVLLEGEANADPANAGMNLDFLNSVDTITEVSQLEVVQDQVQQSIAIVRNNIAQETREAVVQLDAAQKVFDKLSQGLSAKSKKLEELTLAGYGDAKLFAEVRSLKNNVKQAEAALEAAEQSKNALATQNAMLFGFEMQSKSVGSLEAAEELMNSIYTELFSMSKDQKYKEVFDLVNQAKSKKLFLSEKNGRLVIDKDKLDNVAKMLSANNSEVIQYMEEYEPHFKTLRLSMDAANKRILALQAKLGEKLKTLKKGEMFPDIKFRDSLTGEDLRLAEEYEAEIGTYELADIQYESSELYKQLLIVYQAFLKN